MNVARTKPPQASAVENTVQNSPRQPARSGEALRWILSRLGTQLGALVVINLILFIFLSFTSPVFLTPANLLAMGVAMSGNVLAAMGQTVVLLAGAFDLSVGSSYGLAGVMTAQALILGLPLGLALLIGLGVGVIFGLVNGLVVTKLEINPLITTLGTMTMGRGLINLLTRGYSSYGLIDSLAQLTKVKILGLPPSFVFMLLIFIATDVLLRYWRPGRQLYYIGGSPESARLIGIRVDRARILAFVVSGTLAAMGGLLFAARTGAASGQAGIGLELLALTAAFLGGVGFGGEGTALGTFLGATLIALIINAMLLLGIPGLWQNIVIGIFLLVAALIGMTRMRRASAYHRVRR